MTTCSVSLVGEHVFDRMGGTSEKGEPGVASTTRAPTDSPIGGVDDN